MRRRAFFASAAAALAAPILAKTPNLVWGDEFSGEAGSAPDASRWGNDLGAGGWGNGELQEYTAARENSALDGHGNLLITALRTADGKFTSARLKTASRFEVRFGRIEARIKIPLGQGIWPAFWMLGKDLDSIGWPDCGEIDILEQIGREPSRIHSTVHGPGYSGSSGISGQYDLPQGQRFSDAFHVFAVNWTDVSLTFSVDDSPFHEVTRKRLPVGTKWVFDHPFYILLNVAVGGFWPGRPDASTTFPQQMFVDYVRVYRTAR